jgi:hypothetical protein
MQLWFLATIMVYLRVEQTLLYIPSRLHLHNKERGRLRRPSQTDFKEIS